MDLSNPSKKYSYVLACPRQDGTIAILCRNSGSNAGPAFCDSKKNAIKLKTRLSNDPRGIANHRAMELIKSLYVYKIDSVIEPVWDEGSLWLIYRRSKPNV